MSTTPTFGQWLKQRRKVLGLTQNELAQKAGCAEVTLRKIEAGDFLPSTPLAASLAKTVGATDADLPGLVSLARGAGEDFTAKARLLRPQRPNNLTSQLTPLFGRQHDIAAVRTRLLSDGARLVTLVGPPGVGKTRLAQAVAEDVLEHFEHGAYFVRLAPISDPTLVASAIAQALDFPMTGATPSVLQLRAFLEEKHLLLVLDNFEQIVEAAALVNDLLRRCPWLHVLVTSRQPLRVRGERQMPVPPLALPLENPDAGQPTAADVLRYSAVAMFAERAQTAQPDFIVSDGNAATIAELCRRLDGLPLAIELVAARVKLLPPAELLAYLRQPLLFSMDGLRDMPPRQRTLRGAIGWSYDLLSLVEQTLFTRLSVFAGGCTLEAAEMICEDVLSSAQVLEGIASLLDKSLLHRENGLYGTPRYVMLETLREYGLELLTVSGQEELLGERHALCYMRLIEKAEQTGLDPGFIQVRRLIDDENKNIQAALSWAIQHDVQVALMLTTWLLDWFEKRGPLAEGRDLIDKVFALPGAADHTIPRVKALLKAAKLLETGSMIWEAQAYAEEGLALSQELEYDRGKADACWVLAWVAFDHWQDLDAADHYLERSLAGFRTIGDPVGIASVLWFLSEIALYRVDLSRALALAQDALSVAQQGGFRYTNPLWTQGKIAYAEGDLNRARALCEQALAIERQRVQDTGIYARAFLVLANIARRQGDFIAAHAYMRQGQARAKQYGSDNEIVLCWGYLLMAILVQEEGDYRSAVWWYRASLPGMRYDKEDWSDWGLGLAALAVVLDLHELAARLLGATEAVSETVYRLLPIERNDYNRLVDVARAGIGSARFDAAWTEGRSFAFEQAAEEAISILEALQPGHASASR
jgi:predicted ATPase/DNA-binding XRE family transcriptional regulator